MSKVIYVAIISILVALSILIRFILLKREIRRVSGQLQELRQGKTQKKIDLTFYDKDLETLTKEVNEQVDITKQAISKKKRTENELKQAIASISHDIRTPMTSILGYIQFLELEDLNSEERTEYTRFIKSGALRLKVLLEDFFELSIIESADYPLKTGSITLNRLIQEVLVGFYEEFNKRQIEPVIHVPTDDIHILADSSAVKRVIENLVANAIRHSTGDISLTLEKSLSSVQIIISNPAAQLKEEDLFYFFNRFYKTDRTRKGKGTGLGLSIAKGLMNKMDGHLSAELKDNYLLMKCEWKIS